MKDLKNELEEFKNIKTMIKVRDIENENCINIMNKEDFKYFCCKNTSEVFYKKIDLSYDLIYDLEDIKHDEEKEVILRDKIIKKLIGELYYFKLYCLGNNILYSYESSTNDKIEDGLEKLREGLEVVNERIEEKLCIIDQEQLVKYHKENKKIVTELIKYIESDKEITNKYANCTNKKLRIYFIREYLIENKKDLHLDYELIVDLIKIN